MAVSTITYLDKSDINVNSSVPSTNKVQATDMNEIKSVVNNNSSELSKLQGTVIYNNPSGNDLDLVCSETITNFEYLQFDFEHQNSHATVLTPIINNKIQIRSIGIPSNNNTMQFIVQKYTINNKTLELDVEGMTNISSNVVSYQSFTFGSQATIKVKKIIGFSR